jgi:hypothetical protein
LKISFANIWRLAGIRFSLPPALPYGRTKKATTEGSGEQETTAEDGTLAEAVTQSSISSLFYLVPKAKPQTMDQQISQMTPQQRQQVLQQAQQEANQRVMQDMVQKMVKTCFNKCAGTSVRSFIIVI